MRAATRWQGVWIYFVPFHEVVENAVDGGVSLLPGAVCGQGQRKGHVLGGNDVLA